MNEKRREKGRHSGLIRGIAELAIMALVIFGARSSLADWNHVPSGSMEPTLLVGDVILVDRLAYDLKLPFTHWHLAKWADPKRGDIVVFHTGRADMPDLLVKRVIGLPGDIIALDHDRLIVNGVPVAYRPAATGVARDLAARERGPGRIAREALPGRAHAVMVMPGPMPHDTFGPVRVPPGKYLMLGDNRDNSADSRYFGFVDRAQILGRATRVLVSFDYDDDFLPRRDRFDLRLN